MFIFVINKQVELNKLVWKGHDTQFHKSTLAGNYKSQNFYNWPGLNFSLNLDAVSGKKELSLDKEFQQAYAKYSVHSYQVKWMKVH